MGKTPIKVLSLFDGISCARQALHDLGIPVSMYYASEVDKYVDEYADKMYTSCEAVGCTEARDADGLCGTHHFATSLKPDIAVDDIQACELGKINLIVREK